MIWSRTDIASVGKEMAIKSAIVTVGTILEVTLHVPGLPIKEILSTKSPSGVKARLKEATKRGWISEGQCKTLEDLWTLRTNVHLKKLPTSEFDLYKVEHVNAPLEALGMLMSKMQAWHAQCSS
jgi:hypothetical protein